MFNPYKIGLYCLLGLVANLCLAQQEDTIVEDSLFDISQTTPRWDMSLTLKSQNYFRGLLPGKAPTLAANAGYLTGDWIFGMYGGVAFDASYQETDFIVIFHKARFDLRLDYYYNFTSGITDIPEPTGLFDFDKATTRGLLDFLVHIKLDNQNRWDLNTSTFLFGRDTDILTIEAGDESYTVRTDQRYSQYIELKHNWYWNNNKLNLHLGGSFSWHDFNGPTFYGDKAGINNIGLSFTKQFKLNPGLKLPVKASMLMNPLGETAYLIISVNLIQLGSSI
ncbi:hypothetical protein [Sediminicola luteus]|uniref:Outer membrane protein beta-barrel domain-containing protein n=1 Tax=Sediminicola luteus TaxID=319238 RepID=A0A2A4G279_9FLAO|nr:hypothetical protein [Sediminicola luteus]PCE62541.1 hypothetical protein B7P33_18055 [Sediminicola luteus]